VVLDINFTTKNPLFKEERQALGKDGKPSTYKALFAVLTIQEDGRQEQGPSLQPIKVGDAKDYEIVADGRGLKGTKGFYKDSPWIIFLNSLSAPVDGGDGFSEENFPEDPAGLVADYSNIRGVRAMFDWAAATDKWSVDHPRVVAPKDGKPGGTFKRENLVIANYYGQEDITKLAQPKLAGSSNTGSSKAGASVAVDAALVEATAETMVAQVLKAAKENKLTRNKLSVKLLQAMDSMDANLREAVRAFALDVEKLGTLDGVNFDKTSDIVTLG
jgi:hypothetical protein